MAIYNGTQKVKPSGIKDVYVGNQNIYRKLEIYTVVGNGTNATINGSSSYSGTIQEGGTLTLTLGADGSSYKLPTTITVEGTTVTAGVETTIPNKSTVLFTRTSDTNGSIQFSNVTDDVSFNVVGEAVASYPVKGQLINLNLDGYSRQYRVLNINGSTAEILSMYAPTAIEFGDDNTYADSTLDTYLNSTWYGGLTATAKSAIVDKTFTQDSWYLGNDGNPDYSGYYGATKPGATAYTVSLGSATYGSSITRRVYALSVQDVLNYVKDTTIGDGELQNYNIWKMFWNDEVKHYESSWLRSARANYSGYAQFSYAWYVDGYDGFVSNDDVYNTSEVRPALTIDLSKISWS